MSSAPDPIIPAKFTPPPVRDRLVERTTLIETLEKGFACRLTLITAPAGFGKTTLVSAWLAKYKKQVAWLSLDPSDNSPAHFFASLTSAIQRIRPVFGKWSYDLPLLDKQFYDEHTLACFFKEVACLDPGIILVLDDYHLISNPVIHDMLAALIKILPVAERCAYGCHPVIISRSDLPFAVSRMRGQGELNELHARELKFTEAETFQFFCQTLGKTLPPHLITRLVDKTAGWVTGLQFAAFSLKRLKPEAVDDFINHFSGSHYLIADYLFEEIWAYQSPEIQSFLMSTSFLDQMNAQLCNTVREANDSQTLLEQLDRHNLFVIPLDERRSWYRYHPLLLDYLRQRARDINELQDRTLHSRAATWYEQQGDINEAARHWLAAGQTEQAAAIVIKTAFDYLTRGLILPLRDLLEMFPEPAFTRWPWLSIYRCWHYSVLQPGALEHCLAQTVDLVNSAETSISAIEKKEMLGTLSMIQALHHSRHGNIEQANRLALQALETLPPSASKTRGLAFYVVATDCFLKSDLEQAEEILSQGIFEQIQQQSYRGAIRSLIASGAILMIQGKLQAAVNRLNKALSLKAEPPCTIYSILGEILFEWNHVDEAQVHLTHGHELSLNAEGADRLSSSVPLASFFLDLGDLDSAKKILDALESSQINKMLLPMFEANLVTARIYQYALEGNFGQIETLAQKRTIERDAPGSVAREKEGIALAYAYYLCGQWQNAIHLCQKLLPGMSAGGRIDRQLKTMVIQATALKMSGETEMGLSTTIEALKIGFQEGYVRTFLRMGDGMLAMLGTISQDKCMGTKVNRSYLSKVIQGFFLPGSHVGDKLVQSSQGNKNDPLEPLIELLSNRELKVLNLIQKEMSNEEIANFLSISINTVKAHTTNIYSKLGVHNRLEATNRARRLGLI